MNSEQPPSTFDKEQRLAEIEAGLPPTFRPWAMKVMEAMHETFHVSLALMQTHRAWIAQETTRAFFAGATASECARWLAHQILSYK